MFFYLSKLNEKICDIFFRNIIQLQIDCKIDNLFGIYSIILNYYKLYTLFVLNNVIKQKEKDPTVVVRFCESLHF